MKNGLILYNNIKVGEFSSYKQLNIGMWEINNVIINNDLFNISELNTKNNVFLIVIDELNNDNSSNDDYVIGDVIGNGCIYSDSIICSNDVVTIKKATFVDFSGDKNEA